MTQHLLKPYPLLLYPHALTLLAKSFLPIQPKLVAVFIFLTKHFLGMHYMFLTCFTKSKMAQSWKRVIIKSFQGFFSPPVPAVDCDLHELYAEASETP